MKSYFLIGFAIAGVLFRLWLTNLVPQPFMFDQTEYERFAMGILKKGLYVETARLYGYPLILAFIYRILASSQAGLALTIFQASLDSLVAILIFLMGKKLFNRELPALIGSVAYLFNPFTSSYVSLFLTEVVATFLVAFIFFLTLLFIEKKQYVHLLLLSIVLGFLPQVRPPLILFSMVAAASLVFLAKKIIPAHQRIKIVVTFLILFFLPFVYNIVGNLKYFGQFSPTTVDNLLAREFYISLYVAGRSLFNATDPSVFPPQVQQLYNEYSTYPKNKQERHLMAQKYLNLSLQKVGKNPLNFILSRLSKFWYVWEKHFIFYYVQPENKLVEFFTYWLNNTILAAGSVGFIVWFRQVIRGSKWHLKYFAALTFFLFIYISMVYSFSLTEERYSLPGYPMIFLFAGYFLSRAASIKVVKWLNFIFNR